TYASRSLASASFTRLSFIILRPTGVVFRLDDDVYRRAMADVPIDAFERDGWVYLACGIRSDDVFGICGRGLGRLSGQTPITSIYRDRPDGSYSNTIVEFITAKSSNLGTFSRGRSACGTRCPPASGIRIIYSKSYPG